MLEEGSHPYLGVSHICPEPGIAFQFILLAFSAFENSLIGQDSVLDAVALGCNGTSQVLFKRYLVSTKIKKKKLHGLSPRANYTDRATATCQRSDCQLVRIEAAMWSA
jgi:hypothetical protein